MEKIMEILEKYNQKKLIYMLNSFSQDEKKNIENQLKSIDLDNISNLYNSTKQKSNIEAQDITPIDYIDKAKLNDTQFKQYKEIGENIIKNNNYAVVTMAGGQGTRLGHNGPKGTFKVTVNGEEKYLF